MNENGAQRDVNSLEAQARQSTVEADPLEGVPRIDENNVESLSEQVISALTRTS